MPCQRHFRRCHFALPLRCLLFHADCFSLIDFFSFAFIYTRLSIIFIFFIIIADIDAAAIIAAITISHHAAAAATLIFADYYAFCHFVSPMAFAIFRRHFAALLIFSIFFATLSSIDYADIFRHFHY
jgi:hypothetical protein